MLKRRTELSVYVLLSLLEGPLKGYDISKKVYEISEGEINFMNQSPYVRLKKMKEEGLIEVYKETNVNRKIIYYAITDKGIEAIKQEQEVIKNYYIRIQRRMESYYNE